MKGDAYHAINPMLKVPAITYRGAVVTETAAICAYLADAFPDAALAPPLADRAAYYRWLFFAAGCVEAAITKASLGVVPPPEKHGMIGYGSLAETVDALEVAVAGRAFVAGDRFSAADVYVGYVGAQIGWGMAFGSIEKRPAFEAYCAPLVARPAAVRARDRRCPAARGNARQDVAWMPSLEHSTPTTRGLRR